MNGSRNDNYDELLASSKQANADRITDAEQQTSQYDALLESNRIQSDNIAALTDLVSDVIEDVGKRPTKSVLYRALAAVGALLVAIIISLNYASYQSSHDSLNEVKSCTTPEGECAKRGQASQAEAIGSIVCNQEKVVFFLAPETYEPLPNCFEFINYEIERNNVSLPLLEVDPEVPQYGLHKGQ